MYCVEKELESGTVVSITLCGEEKYFIICTICGKKMPLEADDFQEYVEQCGLYGVTWYCEDCYAAHKSIDDTDKPPKQPRKGRDC